MSCSMELISFTMYELYLLLDLGSYTLHQFHLDINFLLFLFSLVPFFLTGVLAFYNTSDSKNKYTSGKFAVYVYSSFFYLYELDLLLYLGVMFHWDDLTLKDLYFLNPQWLCDQLAKVITVREINNFAQGGECPPFFSSYHCLKKLEL